MTGGNRKAAAAKDLKQKIGELGAGVSDQVQGARIGRRIPGRILQTVRHQTEQRNDAEERNTKPATSLSRL